MAEVTITKDNFNKEVLESNIPVLIDFWAPWCGPCRMLGPVVESIAKKYDGVIKVGKVNVDEEGELADSFNVSSIPLLVLIKDAEVKKTSLGYVGVSTIEAMFKEYIK